ncbi:MAG: diaminopimelate epimerase [Clostridiales bacterium]|nr:diaminopimelate epimerase [Clostridiales bacterium]MDD6064857.1 diaminopimelate epimerase [Clostridiales bacterium]
MRFTKMNGAGNDFILVENLHGELTQQQLSKLARTLCDRRMSIGADGLMAIVPAKANADFGMLFFNCDGTLGEMCGNGARCICRYGYETGLAGETQTIETTAGLVTGTRIDAKNYRIRLPDPVNLQYLALDVDGKKVGCMYLELGNPGIPHAVVQYPGLREADEQALFEFGRKLRYHPAFPKGANVNFLEKTGENRFYERTWERGVEDFTYACGTGTGASVYALAEKRRCGDHAEVEVKGGLLIVDIVRDGKKCRDLLLTGPASMVCTGEIFDEAISQ